MSETQLPEGYLVEVRMMVRLPVAATPTQAEEWLEMEMTGLGGAALDNPLRDHAPEAFGPGQSAFEVTFTNQIGAREEFGHKPLPCGGVSYSVRYTRRWIDTLA